MTGNIISGNWLMVNFFENWRPVGWFYLDLALYLIYAVMLASLFFIMKSQFKRSRTKPLRLKTLTTIIMITLLVEFGIGSFVLLVFNGAGRSVRIQVDSPVMVAGDDAAPIAISKMRMVIPNGQSNGISTSVSHFELIGIDMNTGQRRWHRKSGWQEYVIGNTGQGILTVNAKKKKLQFIDPLTGKTSLTEKELVAQYPELKDNLSYSYTDYRVTSTRELYLYAQDGSYYKVDFAEKKTSVNAEYKELLTTASRTAAAIGLSDTEGQAISEQLSKLYPELLDKTVLHAESGSTTILIGYYHKRNDKLWSISQVSLQEHSILWKTQMDRPKDQSYAVVHSDNTALIFSNGKQYHLNMETGKMDYEYIYRWNKTVKQ
jgi:hypothetical protein